MDIRERYERAKLTRDMYPEFVEFCREAMAFLGFKMTWMQADIAHQMQYGSDKQLIEAQRGEAKSTIACIYGLWALVQQPSHRVLLISGSQDKADENGMLMHGLLHKWPRLEYLKPDKYAGDRVSTVEFDVHYSLKGIDKSASVNCIGVTASLQGLRADILLPDDIETTKNGLTATQRDHLALLSREFTSICTHGRILYLGTPQTKDSVYNGLPARGFEVRIWPGRFPTLEQEEAMQGNLAPSVVQRMELLGDRCRSGGGLDGSRGWPTDPHRFDEEELCSKELDQGPETFELQFMLNTRLMDEARQQLKLRDLIVPDIAHDSVPETLAWAADPRLLWPSVQGLEALRAELHRPASTSEQYTPLRDLCMTVDPAGEGGDELAFCIGGVVGPYIHVAAWGGLRGGFADQNLEKLVQLIIEFNVKRVVVEKNMGAGAVTKLLLNYMNGTGPDGKRRVSGVGVDEEYSTGQKERRIIDSIRPILQRHRLVLHRRAVQMDAELTRQYSADKRLQYSGLYQLQNITTDRGSLLKDDRVDVLEQLCRQLVGYLVIDEEKEQRTREKREMLAFIQDPMGTGNHKPAQRGRNHAALRRRFGRRGGAQRA